MHCDRVYTILTRGPFPSGEPTDVAVEIHLAHCVTCRRLAEALRPVDRPLNEAISAEESRLPGYRGDHPAWDSNSPATFNDKLILPSGRSIMRRGRRAVSRLQAGRFAATMVLGAVIGVVLSTIGPSGTLAQHKALVGAAIGGRYDDRWDEARVQAQLINGLNLPRDCSRLDMQLFAPLSADERWPAHLTAAPPSFLNQCCTQCHVAGGRTQLGQAQRSVVISSCTICHAASPRRTR